MQSTLNFKATRANTNQDPSADSSEGKKRRRRDFYSCDPCRSHKVKCDRGHPCGRCKNAKRTAACTYKDNPPRKIRARANPASIDGDSTARSEDVTPSYISQGSDINERSVEQSFSLPDRRTTFTKYKKGGNTKYKGQTHWSILLLEFDEMCQYMRGEVDGFLGMKSRLKSMKHFYNIRRTRNYPFGDERTKSCSKASILSYLPEEHLIITYTNSYLNSFEKTHRLLHAKTFNKELAAFLQHPEEVDFAWLSQLFMMLALGYQCTRGVESGSREDLSTVDTYLDGAEACLLASPFMWRPTLTIIRTLCMMAIAKQIDIVSMDSPDSVWTLIGTVIRLAMFMGIHRDSSHFPKMTLFESEMRKRVWNTIVYINLQASIESGMPLLLNTTDFDSSEPANINDEELFEDVKQFPTRNDISCTDSTFQILLARSFTTISNITSHANSSSSKLDYAQTLKADLEVRAFLQQACALFDTTSSGVNSTNRATWMELQKTTLDLFFRRVLLILHRPYSYDTVCRLKYPDSYWSTLECSLAFLVHQRKLYETTDNTVSIEWFAELFKSDFFTAAISVCLRIRRDDISGDEQHTIYPLPAKQIISETLLACYDIWERKIGLSGNHFKTHMVVGMMIAVLNTRASGEPLLPAMLEAGEKSLAAGLKARGSTHANLEELNIDVGLESKSAESRLAAGQDSQLYTAITPDIFPTESPDTLSGSIFDDISPFLSDDFGFGGLLFG